MSQTIPCQVIPGDRTTFMMTSLCLQFCLWFMYHGEDYFLNTKSRRNIRKIIKSEILRLTDHIQLSFLDIRAFYRAIDLDNVASSKITLNFFKKLCKDFRNVKHLTLTCISEETMDWALDAFQPIFKQLSTLTIQSLGYYASLPTYLDALGEGQYKRFDNYSPWFGV